MKLFALLLKLTPSIIQLIFAIETAIGPGNGPIKLNLLLNSVNTAAEAIPEVAADIKSNDAQAAITKLVGTTVAVLNTSGVFKK